MTLTSAALSAVETRRPRWRAALIVVALAVVFAELEAVQSWLETRHQPFHDRFSWAAWAMLPPWLLMAALVPVVAALCRRFPLSHAWPRSLGVHAVASLVFPVVHLGALALFHNLLGDRTPLVPRIGGLLAFHYLFDVLAYWAIAGALLLTAARSPATDDAQTRPAGPARQLVVRDAAGVHVVPVDTIDWIEARNYCARIHAAGRRHLIRESLNSLEARLDPGRFARVHRSAIVSVDRIAALRLDAGRPVVVLRGEVAVPASLDRWRSLKKRLQLAMLALLFVPAFQLSSSPALLAQTSRNWRPEDRALLTDLSYVTAVAATRSVVYAATPNGLAVYDRAVRAWRQTVGPLDGFPRGIVTAMAADPSDDLAWMAGPSQWLAYDPFTRRLDSGALPGAVDQVVLDAREPSRGAYFHTSAGWYFVARGALVAAPALDLPAPGSRIGGMTGRELLARLPALDAVRLRIERDDQLRSFRLTSAAVAPLTNDIVVGTDGNGAFRIDPVTYAADRFPAGLLGSAPNAVAAWRGQICTAGEARAGSPRQGIACFDERASGFTYFEFDGAAGFAGAVVRRLLVTERAVWAATDQGLLRVPRRGGRLVQVLTRDGLPSDRIYALAAAPTGAYVGTGGGLAVVSDTGRGVVVVETAQGPPVLALAATGADTVWAGTSAGVVAFLLPLGGAVSVPAGPGPLHDPVVGIAIRGDIIVAATESRFLVRAGGEWRVVEPPGHPVGRIASVVADEAGWWVAGDQGFAFFDPSGPRWNALFLPGDVPLPVHDIAASRDEVWVATDVGLVRYDKRVLVP